MLRAALGAGRGRLVRQSLTELLPLLLLGGLAGVLLARLLLGFTVPLLPATMPRVETIDLDLYVLLFAAGTLVVTGLATESGRRCRPRVGISPPPSRIASRQLLHAAWLAHP